MGSAPFLHKESVIRAVQHSWMHRFPVNFYLYGDVTALIVIRFKFSSEQSGSH